MSREEAAEVISRMIENRYLYHFTMEELIALRMALAFLIGTPNE